MIKEIIKELNRAMYYNEISFDCVDKILEQISKSSGDKYTILNRRVVIITDEGNFDDAYISL